MLVHQFYQSPALFCPPPGAAGLPINSPGAPPTVIGPTEENQTLTCLRGTWTGDEPITYAYQWFRAGAMPANTVAPHIDNDTPTIDEPVECSEGFWTGSPTGYSYQWFRWTADVGGVPTGTVIFGATGSIYVPVGEEPPPPEGTTLTTDGEMLTNEDGEGLTT